MTVAAAVEEHQEKFIVHHIAEIPIVAGSNIESSKAKEEVKEVQPEQQPSVVVETVFEEATSISSPDK
jgi:hypothetical protein